MRRFAKSFYVYGVTKGDLPDGIKGNSSDGCTITFKKRGGILNAWNLTKKVARYPNA